MQNRTNFNAIAPFYDRLCQLVFGQKVKKAQIESLAFIPPNSTILIAGGGTGWILDEIAQKFPSGLNITYIDKSSEMIRLSKKRNYALNTIEFINEDIEDVRLSHQKYNVILTPFFLDCFSQSIFQSIFKKLDDSLMPGGLWLNVDFYLSAASKQWQKVLIKIMYVFFRMTCKIEASKLPSINSGFSQYILSSEKMYCNNFIKAQVFKKSQ